jgi:hypothetical protein
MRLLVTGTCRSGTWYLTRCLHAAGLDIGHEALKPDGTVSGFMWLNHPWYPSKHERPGDPAPSKVSYTHRWHLVRDPLATIPSLAYVLDNDGMQRWLASLYEAEVLPDLGNEYRPVTEPWPQDAAMRASLRYWTVATENAIATTEGRVYLETVQRQWPLIRHDLGLRREFPVEIRVPNAQGRGRTTWGDLYRIDPQWAERAESLALRLGYWKEG